MPPSLATGNFCLWHLPLTQAVYLWEYYKAPISNCNLTGEPSGKNIYLYYENVVISLTRWEIVSVWITFYISGYFRNHNLSQSKLFPLIMWSMQTHQIFSCSAKRVTRFLMQKCVYSNWYTYSEKCIFSHFFVHFVQEIIKEQLTVFF